jgi:hypothetical protein
MIIRLKIRKEITRETRQRETEWKREEERGLKKKHRRKREIKGNEEK